MYDWKRNLLKSMVLIFKRYVKYKIAFQNVLRASIEMYNRKLDLLKSMLLICKRYVKYKIAFQNVLKDSRKIYDRKRYKHSTSARADKSTIFDMETKKECFMSLKKLKLIRSKLQSEWKEWIKY